MTTLKVDIYLDLKNKKPNSFSCIVIFRPQSKSKLIHAATPQSPTTKKKIKTPSVSPVSIILFSNKYRTPYYGTYLFKPVRFSRHYFRMIVIVVRSKSVRFCYLQRFNARLRVGQYKPKLNNNNLRYFYVWNINFPFLFESERLLAFDVLFIRAVKYYFNEYFFLIDVCI